MRFYIHFGHVSNRCESLGLDVFVSNWCETIPQGTLQL